MPTLSSGSNVTLTVAAGQILTVQSDGATFDFENPVGTRVGEYAADTVFGPFTAGASVKITSVQGPVFYELGLASVPTVSGVPVRPYIGLVASRGSVPTGTAGSNKQGMARSKHVAMEDISSLQLVFANFYTANPSPFEYNAGAAGQYTASIEYPVGTLTQVRFGGSATGNVADGGILISDSVAVSIPRGAAFYVRMWQSNTAGLLYNVDWGLTPAGNNAASPSGEWFVFGATTTDLTLSTSNVNNQQGGVSLRPAAIIGYTKRPTFYLAGDSRLSSGVSYDASPNSYGGKGEVERSLVRGFATLNAGCPGDTMANAAGANYTKRIQLAQYCSHVICEYGINDFGAGTSAATTLANLATFAAKFGGKPVFQTTISPQTTSTDSWATTVNQTTNATSNPIRVSFNGSLRQGQFAAPVVGHIEVADQLESARDSGLWKVTGSANGYTADGLHGNAVANALIEASAAFQNIVVG